jgi:hypothetical protein
VTPPRAADQVWRLVPGWTKWRDQHDGGGLLKALVEATGVGLDEAQRDLERLLDNMFVETCDQRLLPLIGDLVGARVDPRIPVVRQRHQVAYAIHLRRRRGTVEELETLGWQVTGFPTTVREAQSTQRTVLDPPLAARVNGGPGASAALAVDVTRTLPGGTLEVTFVVARPVRRAQMELVQIRPDLHAIDPRRAVGLRRADGTPILRGEDPADLVGPGCPIELTAIGADFYRLGDLRPWFTSLPDGARVYVPARAIAIDPERGRVAGPTGVAPGLRVYRRYRLAFWLPLGAEQAIVDKPAPQGNGVFTFAPDSASDALTDADGHRLMLAFEGERPARAPLSDQRVLVVREQPRHHRAPRAPFLLLAPGEAMPWPLAGVPRGALPLDVTGLSRLFSVEDDWGWDRFRRVRLVAGWGSDPPPDDTVEIDVEGGRFRVGPAHEREALRVRYYRRHDVEEIKRLGVEAIRNALPLGRAVTFTFRDTPIGPLSAATVRSRATGGTEDPLS